LVLVVGETSQVVVVKQQGPVEESLQVAVVMPLVPAEETTSPVPEAERRQLEEVAPEAVAPWAAPVSLGARLTLEAVEHLALPAARSLAVTSRVQVVLVHNRPPAVT
jgi:hypothetical protein